jgi:hypothetical protein
LTLLSKEIRSKITSEARRGKYRLKTSKRVCWFCRTDRSYEVPGQGWELWYTKGDRYSCQSCYSKLSYSEKRDKILSKRKQSRDIDRKNSFSPRVKEQSEVQKKLVKKILRSNAYFRKELEKATQTLQKLKLDELRSAPKTYGVA